MTNEEIKNKLYALKDEKYRQFSMKLLPGVDSVIGVRIPEIRKLSKCLDISYLDFSSSKDSFEEIMLQGMIIGNIKNISQAFFNISQFLPLIDNWSVCDSFCSSLKITKKYPDEMWDYLKPLWEINEPFVLRFCLVMSLNYFINDKYIESILKNISQIKNDHYYVLMAIAWFLSIAYKKYPEIIKEYLKKMDRKSFVFTKTIQKILELKNISQEEKIYLNTLKHS